MVFVNSVRYVGTKTENVFGVDNGQIWLSNVQCNGRETDIDECSHSGWGVHNCGHHEDVAVSCTSGTARSCRLANKVQLALLSTY